MKALVTLCTLLLILAGCSDDKSTSGAEIDALKQQRAALAAQLKQCTDQRFELSNSVIPAKNAFEAAKRRAGGEEGASEVQEAKQLLDEASAAFERVYNEENRVKAQLEEVEEKLRRAGVK